MFYIPTQRLQTMKYSQNVKQEETPTEEEGVKGYLSQNRKSKNIVTKDSIVLQKRVSKQSEEVQPPPVSTRKVKFNDENYFEADDEVVMTNPPQPMVASGQSVLPVDTTLLQSAAYSKEMIHRAVMEIVTNKEEPLYSELLKIIREVVAEKEKTNESNEN